MAECHPKWIIEDGHLILGKVAFHKELVIHADQCVGGGWWKMDVHNKTLHLYSKSEDFGRASIEQVTNCVKKGFVGLFHAPTRYGDWKVTYSQNSGFIVEQQIAIT